MHPTTDREREAHERREACYALEDLVTMGRSDHAPLPQIGHPVEVSDGKQWVPKAEYEARKLAAKKLKRKRRKSA